MIITCANVKGGSGKTTSAMHLAAAVADQGRKLIFVDADSQASARRWHKIANKLGEPLPFEFEFLPTPELAEEVDELLENHDDMVIDVGPANADIMLAAIAVADFVVIPLNAREDDRQQAHKTHDDCARHGIAHAVLLNRVKTSETTSIAVTRSYCADNKIPIFTTVVPDHVAIGDAFGARITDPGPFTDVLAEIEALTP